MCVDKCRLQGQRVEALRQHQLPAFSGIPHSNNAAESQLRNAKRRQAAAVGFRSVSGP